MDNFSTLRSLNLLAFCWCSLVGTKIVWNSHQIVISFLFLPTSGCPFAIQTQLLGIWWRSMCTCWFWDFVFLDGLFFYNHLIQSQRLPCSDLFIYWVFSPILRYRLVPFGFVTWPKSTMNIWCLSKWIPRLCHCWIVDSRDQRVSVLLIFYIRLFISPLCRNSSWLCYSPSILIFCVAKHWMSGG